ncbi:MAG: tetratricopeptide repeat protein [Polyangia bacterium]
MNVTVRVLGTLLVLSGGLAVITASSPVLGSPGSPTESLIDSGSQLIEAEDYTAALDKLDRAARLDPKDPRPHYLAAVAWEKKGDLTKAEKGFREALALDPKLADVRGELGALLQDLGRSDEAVTELKKAVQLSPELGDAWFNLGQAELKRHRCADAEVAFGRAAALKAGDPDPLIQRTVALRECKKPDEAVKTARQAVKGSPSSAPAQVNLGLALESQGKVAEGRAALQAATRLKPDYATAWWSLGLLELHAKKPTEAKAAFERARSLAPTAPHIADLGRAWRDLGDFGKAEAYFKEALAKDAHFSAGHFYLAQLYAAGGRCSDMNAELERSQVPAEKAKSVRSSCKSKK